MKDFKELELNELEEVNGGEFWQWLGDQIKDSDQAGASLHEHDSVVSTWI